MKLAFMLKGWCLEDPGDLKWKRQCGKFRDQWSPNEGHPAAYPFCPRRSGFLHRGARKRDTTYVKLTSAKQGVPSPDFSWHWGRLRSPFSVDAAQDTWCAQPESRYGRLDRTGQCVHVLCVALEPGASPLHRPVIAPQPSRHIHLMHQGGLGVGVKDWSRMSPCSLCDKPRWQQDY